MTASVSGYNKVLNSIVPPIVEIYQNARTQVIDGINQSYGHDLIDYNSGRYNWTPGGDVLALTEFGN